MKYFTIAELTYSETAEKNNIDNTPDKNAENNLEALVDNVLDVMREIYGEPINVSSGYRSRALNAKVHGVSNSEHLTGCAADLTVKEGYAGLLKLMEIVIVNRIPFRQMIIERSGKSVWLHISYQRNGVNDRQILTYVDGSYTRVTPEWVWTILFQKDLPIAYKDIILPFEGCNYK